jgi:hypothetical protein
MSKADEGHVDFVIRTKLIGLSLKKWTVPTLITKLNHIINDIEWSALLIRGHYK